MARICPKNLGKLGSEGARSKNKKPRAEARGLLVLRIKLRAMVDAE
jgi:hypothetical protein